MTKITFCCLYYLKTGWSKKYKNTSTKTILNDTVLTKSTGHQITHQFFTTVSIDPIIKIKPVLVSQLGNYKLLKRIKFHRISWLCKSSMKVKTGQVTPYSVTLNSNTIARSRTHYAHFGPKKILILTSCFGNIRYIHNPQ